MWSYERVQVRYFNREQGSQETVDVPRLLSAENLFLILLTYPGVVFLARRPLPALGPAPRAGDEATREE